MDEITDAAVQAIRQLYDVGVSAPSIASIWEIPEETASAIGERKLYWAVPEVEGTEERPFRTFGTNFKVLNRSYR